jgi:hypothetical protein
MDANKLGKGVALPTIKGCKLRTGVKQQGVLRQEKICAIQTGIE